MRRLDVLPATRRRARAGIVLALIAALLCWPVAVVALTTNLTVQRAGYYRQAVDDTDVYRRLYDEVLADPAVAGVTRDLLAGVPVPADVVVDSLRLVAPASAVRGAVNTLSSQISGYLGGQRPTLTLSVDLRPMFAAIAKLATIYLAGQISGTPTFQAHDVAAVTGILVGGLDQMAQGRRPAGIPTMDLTGEQADQIGSALLARLPAVERARVRDRVGGLLRQGKVPAALAVVGPMLFQGDEAALTDLRRRLAGDQLDLGAPLARAHESAGVGLLHALHALGRWGTVTLEALLAATAVLSVLLAAQHARCGRGDTMLLVAGGMVIGGATALLLGLLLPTLVGDPTAGIISANPTLPLRVRNLLHDLQGTMIDRIRTEWEQVAAGVVLAGCLLGLVGLLVRRRRWPLRRRRSVALALSAALLLSSSWLVTPAHFGGEAASCNGSRALCALRYDKAVYAASHNAMASSADDFVGATQDPDLVGQLDTGVRALLLDVQRWTTPMQVETFLARLRPRERDALEPLVRHPARPVAVPQRVPARLAVPGHGPALDRRVAGAQPVRGRDADPAGLRAARGGDRRRPPGRAVAPDRDAARGPARTLADTGAPGGDRPPAGGLRRERGRPEELVPAVLPVWGGHAVRRALPDVVHLPGGARLAHRADAACQPLGGRGRSGPDRRRRGQPGTRSTRPPAPL